MGSLKKLKGRGAAALFTLIVLALPATAWANAGGEGPDVVGALSGLTVFTAAALLFHFICSRIGLPAILGWILAGVAVGNIPHPYIHNMIGSEFLSLLGEIGIVLLMFRSGLEARPADIKNNIVGAGAVALLGVLFVGAFGYGVALMFLPGDSHWMSYVYIAVAVTPTSAGIGVALFNAKKVAAYASAIMTTVAAVIDDVIGLIGMAILGALVKVVTSGAEIAVGPIMIEAAKGFGFVAVGFWLGVWVLPRVMPGALKMKQEFVFPAAVVAAGGIGCLGTLFGLAPLIGAYVAGIVFEQVRYKEVAPDEHSAHVVELEHAMEYPVAILAPIFFVLIGTKVPISAFGDIWVLGLAAALTVATVIGKILSGVGVVGGAYRPTVIAGMMPRGEVAGILVKTGAGISVAGIPLISEKVYAAFVLMITATTVICILALNRTLRKEAEMKAKAQSRPFADGGR